MAIYRTPKEQIDAYYQNASLNQTALKAIINGGMQPFLAQAQNLLSQEDQPYYEEKEHFLVGGAVDCYLTQGEECYLNTYYFSNVKKPTDTVMSIIKMVYDKLKVKCSTIEKDLHKYKWEIYEACNAQKYYTNRARPNAKDTEANQQLPDENHITWEADERWKDIVKGTRDGKDVGALYFNDLIEADGKQVLSDSQNQIINKIIGNFTSHPFTAGLFQDLGDIDIVYQQPFYFSVDGVPCKALLDKIRIDHARQAIIPIDIKTIGDYVTRFNRQLKVRRYDIQGSFYTTALEACLEQLSQIIGKDIRHYRIANFAFIAESTSHPVTPLIFVLTKELLNIAKYGNGDDIKGWLLGIELYRQWDNAGFSLENMFSDHSGVLHIGEDFTYNKTF